MFDIDNKKLGELCHIVSTRYDIQTRRQRARSKVGYYNRLYVLIFETPAQLISPKTINGYAIWKKRGRLALNAEIKKWQAEQLLAESKLDLLSSKTTARVRKLTDELDVGLIYLSGQNKVRSIYITSHKKHIDINQIRDLAGIYAAESILLTDEDISYV